MTKSDLFLLDDDGEETRAGDKVRFSYGIPPVSVLAVIVRERNSLYALCFGHKPETVNLRSLRRHVGNWYKEAAAGGEV